jgi:dihydrofolate synthase/folylpolyglutamate synthase
VLEVEAVRRAASKLNLPGRLEVVVSEPLVVLDGAHNPSGARALAESLPAVVGERRVIAVVSVLEDKDAAGILAAIMPLCSGAVFTRSARPGALPPPVLQSLWSQLGGPGPEIVADPEAALEAARGRAGEGGAVLVTGSIYLLAKLAAQTAALSGSEAAR